MSPNSEQLIKIAELVDGGVLQPAIDEVFQLPKARMAFERSRLPHGVGKIVLRIAEE